MRDAPLPPHPPTPDEYTTVMCVWLLICWVCMLGGSFIEHNTNPHSIFHTHTHLFIYTYAVIYTTLSSDIRHYCHRKPGAPSSTGDTRVAWSWPTSRSAAVRHQRARYAVWTDTSQTTRRGIPRHETTRIVLDVDAQTFVFTCLEITVFVRIKTVEHAFCTGCTVRALLSERFSGVVSR